MLQRVRIVVVIIEKVAEHLNLMSRQSYDHDATHLLVAGNTAVNVAQKIFKLDSKVLSDLRI